MRIGLNILGALLVLVGVVWSLQGLNLLGGSFMTGQGQWLAIGVRDKFSGGETLPVREGRELRVFCAARRIQIRH